MRFEHRPLGKCRRIRDLGLGARNPGKKSTESVGDKQMGTSAREASLTTFASDQRHQLWNICTLAMR